MDFLLNIPLTKDCNGEARPRELTLEADAVACMQGFEKWVEPQLGELGELGGINDWAGKIVGAVGRIAGILHMAGSAGTLGSWDHPISRETVENAIQIGRYLIPHAKAAFADMGADEFVGQAKIILRWIEQNSSQGFSRRDLHQALRGTFKRVEHLERPLGSSHHTRLHRAHLDRSTQRESAYRARSSISLYAYDPEALAKTRIETTTCCAFSSDSHEPKDASA